MNSAVYAIPVADWLLLGMAAWAAFSLLCLRSCLKVVCSEGEGSTDSSAV
ncbi:hypothetical protein M3P05_16775 [Sansalvadorimonas sp. 2012CJ34-2]|uniref:Uncharacterized protein n=1 Tax=Parendozoicomonas callyspongiae TaxID=2942213 RepID=A0ABT0PJK9_9GAMM|nr:hypothetical protein [Sansalvadorimonas sp. 2012CJ34-2]MCL6271572.1 hypothetical protein [Sansalvadorimonas sp. 2012CJ34-2]